MKCPRSALNRWLVRVCLALSAWLVPQVAFAQDSKAAAEALFVEGRNLMERGEYDAACAKFAASQRLDAGVGTKLNLADCYEKSGRTASAWAEYRELAPLARAAGSEERASLAEQRAKALEPQLSTLTIRVPEAPSGAELEVRRDGIPIDEAMFSTAIPVDPGRHEIVASAPGFESWSTESEVEPGGDRVVVEIPLLEPASAGVVGGAADSGLSSASAEQDERGWPAQKTWGLVAGGAGLLSLGAGGVLLAVAASELSSAKTLCPTYPSNCSAESQQHNANAGTYGDTATALLIVGGVGVALGTVLWITAPKTKSAQVGLGLGSLELRGTF